MKPSLAIILAAGMIAALAITPLCMAQSQITGDWQGTLDTGGPQLRLALHITAVKDGTLSATLDSVDQGVNAIPVTQSLSRIPNSRWSLMPSMAPMTAPSTRMLRRSTAPGRRASQWN